MVLRFRFYMPTTLMFFCIKNNRMYAYEMGWLMLSTSKCILMVAGICKLDIAKKIIEKITIILRRIPNVCTSGDLILQVL